MVPDVALIENFDFYVTKALDSASIPYGDNKKREAWNRLAQVCRKWRDIVFGSPRRLNVRIFFHVWRSLRAMLYTWPPLPIDIWVSDIDLRYRGVRNIVAALRQNDRINKIEVCGSSKFHLEQAFGAMQKPFPYLTELTVTLC